MITKPKVRKRRVSKLIERHAGGTHATNALPALAPGAREELLAQVSLAESEEGLLACYLRAGQWCLLTTERLLWRREQAIKELAWPEVRGAEMPLELWDRVVRWELPKDRVEELLVVDPRGTRHSLRLEKGDGYFLVWSAILALGNLPAASEEASAPG